MYIGVMIDSESYTELICVERETLNEVKCEMESIAFDWDFGEVTWENIPFKCEKLVARGVAETGDYNEYWFVTEIFKVNKDKVYLVKWHAYEGVDFDVMEFDTWDDAYNEMKKIYNYEMNEYEKYINKEDCYIDTYRSCIDDNVEWNLMQIVTKGE